MKRISELDAMIYLVATISGGDKEVICKLPSRIYVHKERLKELLEMIRESYANDESEIEVPDEEEYRGSRRI